MVGVRTALIDTPAMDWSFKEPIPPPLILPVLADAADEADAPLLSALLLPLLLSLFFFAVAMAFMATACPTELKDATWLATALLVSLTAAVLLLKLLGVLFFLASRSTLETQLVVFLAVTPEEGAGPDPAEASLLLLLLSALLLVVVVAAETAATSLGTETAVCSRGAGGVAPVLTALLEVEEDATGEGELSLKLSAVGGFSICSDDGPDCFKLPLLPWDAPPTSLFFIFMALALAAACLATAETVEVEPSIHLTGATTSVVVDDCRRRCRISWSADDDAASPLLSPPFRLPRLRPFRAEDRPRSPTASIFVPTHPLTTATIVMMVTIQMMVE